MLWSDKKTAERAKTREKNHTLCFCIWDPNVRRFLSFRADWKGKTKFMQVCTKGKEIWMLVTVGVRWQLFTNSAHGFLLHSFADQTPVVFRRVPRVVSSSDIITSKSGAPVNILESKSCDDDTKQPPSVICAAHWSRDQALHSLFSVLHISSRFSKRN